MTPAEHRALRQRLLALMYDARRQAPRFGHVTRHALEGQFGPDLDFDLDYLTERGLCTHYFMRYRITAAGIYAVEFAG